VKGHGSTDISDSDTMSHSQTLGPLTNWLSISLHLWTELDPHSGPLCCFYNTGWRTKSRNEAIPRV